MPSKRIHDYPGEQVDVQWHEGLCIHIGECGRAQGGLFVGGRKPWCQPDLVAADDVAEVVQRCPSGALSYRRKDGAADEQPALANTVTVLYNGPLYLRGDLHIEGADEAADGLRFRAALCRCGASSNKPWCDNSHEKIGFRDTGAVGERGEGTGASGGPLQVKPSVNGPLLFNGNFTVVAASGREAWCGSRKALCRCGQSGNKPFCDGTHKKVGFTSD